jgi:hypothetical protein
MLTERGTNRVLGVAESEEVVEGGILFTISPPRVRTGRKAALFSSSVYVGDESNPTLVEKFRENSRNERTSCPRMRGAGSG